MFVSGDTTPWIIEILQNALNTWNERLGQVFTILTTSPQSFGGGVIYDVIKSINGAMQSIGLSLLVIFLLVGVVKKSTSFEDMKRPEQILKLFLRFVVGKVVISYGMPLMSEILSVGLGIISNMGTTQIASISIAPEIVAAAQDAGFMATLFPSILALLGSLIMTVVSVMILLTVFGRMFKIYMYMAISPIPLSTFAGETTKNVGASFLKSFMGVCLEGALIMLACVIYTAYIGSTGSSILLPADASLTDMLYSYVFGTVLNMLILLGTIKSCDRIVREMLFS
ncbi:MAG TPA: hypothetical protein PKB13_03630 [Clostridia bacterium]|nr:hypothetical protein [Clostridia bacterium]